MSANPVLKTNASGTVAQQELALNIARVLVVDDTPRNIALLVRILKSEGYDVLIAEDGPAALAIAHEQQPDILLLDIEMPEIDGFEVCTQLKASAATAHIPVIFISALSDTDGIVHALEIGGVDYITKPFKVKEVIARVRSQLVMLFQRRQIEALRAQDRKHFEALDQMKERFIQMATHDLKNPLGIIMGYAEMMRRVPLKPESESFFQESIEAILKSVDKMRGLVGDMLDLSQLQTGADLCFESVDLRTFMASALTGCALMAQQNGQEFVYHEPPPDTQIVLDARRISRVIDNLVSNAMKYTPEHGRVEVRIDLTPQEVIIHVADTGLGIPAEDIPQLFDAFFRVKRKEHHAREGTGLGLALVKSVVEQHQGRIEVESELGHGSVFSVFLPRGLTPVQVAPLD